MNTQYCVWTIVLTMVITSTPAFSARPWWDDGRQSSPSTPPPSSPRPFARPPPSSPWWENRDPPSFPQGMVPFPRDDTLWRKPNSEMWGMFLFGGAPQVMERWMDRMEYWGDRMENWADRWQGQGGSPGNYPNPLHYLNPNPFTDGYEPWLDPALTPWLDRWEHR